MTKIGRKKLLFYADTQTVFVLDWVNLLFNSNQYEILVVCSTTGRIFNDVDLPLDLSINARNNNPDSSIIRVVKSIRRLALKYNISSFEKMLDLYRLYTITKYAEVLQSHITRFKPDIIHAMRIPFEGIIATSIDTMIPIVLSIWGNDLTLHAAKGGRKENEIRRSILKATAIHVDAERDLHLLKSEFNFKSNHSLMVPASGGFNAKNLRLDITKSEAKKLLGFKQDSIIICNPRGIRPYIDTELFVSTCEKLHANTENNVFFILIGPGDDYSKWSFSEDATNNNSRLITVGNLGIERFRLLLRAMDIFVSPSTHDGMPISLLEGMGSGAFPILSDIDSIRMVVKHDNQARLFELKDQNAFYDQILDVIKNVDFEKASKENELLTYNDYSIEKCNPKILTFYSQILRDKYKNEDING